MTATRPVPPPAHPAGPARREPGGPQRASDTSRRFARRAASRARFVAATVAEPRLRGLPMTLGPRTDFTFAAGGTFRRGARCTVAGDFHGYFAGDVAWGHDVFFNVGAYVSVFEGLRIGDGCRFGERVSIHDEDHVFEPVGADRSDHLTSPVVIGDDVWVGAGAVVLRGTTLGAGCVVAAGAVVRGDFAPGQLVGGVPARVLRPLRTGEQHRV